MAALVTAIACLGSGCTAERDEVGVARARARPNVLWIVWDTVRADHLSLYGYERKTTPHLERWARKARVFEDCRGTGSSTVPTHGSMFTGLLPSRHGASFAHRWLDDSLTTVAEHLRDAGYQTFLWSANPHISSEENFQQGFETELHPWSPDYRERAIDMVRAKAFEGATTREVWEQRGEDPSPWMITSSGPLAREALEQWLEAREPERPFFAFLNYMEAHIPYLPSRRLRERVMRPELVEPSYRIDTSWVRWWSYSFGLVPYTDEELEIIAGLYDGGIAELDEMFDALLASLEARGELENTIVVLTADHGEQLGEHHLLDHQYSLYDPLTSVPLVVRYPPRFKEGRDPRPVVNFDLFPTLLELAQVRVPPLPEGSAASLFGAAPKRMRVAELPAIFSAPFKTIERIHPGWDPQPWQRRLVSLEFDPWKFIWSEDGRYELYDLRSDPGELDNLVSERPEVASRLLDAVRGNVEVLLRSEPREAPALSPEHLERLRSLGYAEPDPEPR